MKAIVLTTPSLGARAEIRRDKVILRVGNEGGRGAASHILLLPVSSDDPARMSCELKWDQVGLGSDGGSKTWQVYCRALDGEPTGPFVESVPLTEWIRGNPSCGPILVVLSFGNPLVAAPDGSNRLSEDAGKELEKLLGDSEKFAWRRRGLVLLDPQGVAALMPAPPNAKPGASAAGAKPSPGAQASSVVFVLASCQYPAGIVDGTPPDFVALRNADETPRGPADASLLRLHDRLVTAAPTKRPSLLLLAGDQVYVDATAGLFDARAVVKAGVGAAGNEEDWLRVPYQNWLGGVGAQSVFGRLRTRMMFDDHEISDNWERKVGSAESEANEALTALKTAGTAAYGRYQSAKGLNPPYWEGTFKHSGIRFFLADTRTGRDARTANSEFRKPYPAGVRPPPPKPNAKSEPQAPHILDYKQHMALDGWLDGQPDQPAFILSPSIFLPRRLSSSRRSLGAALHSDAWDGYPVSLEGLLASIGRKRRSGLVFLSGDEHLSCVVQATVRACHADGSLGEPVVLHSIHSSALYAPFPFANAVPEEFAAPEHWCFADPCDPAARYRCDVEVLHWIPGDGYACLRLTHGLDGGWSLDVSFDRAEGEIEIPPLAL